MNRLMQWVMAAALICSSTVFTGCSKSDGDDVQEPVVKPDPVVNPDPDDNGANSGSNEIGYIECSWNGTEVVKTPKAVAAKNLANCLPEKRYGEDLSSGVYYVSGNLSSEGHYVIKNGSKVDLVLCDGAVLELSHIVVDGIGSRLRIFGQEKGTGTLKITPAYHGDPYPGIGAYDDDGCDLEFHGGNIIAQGPDATGSGGPAIGSGQNIGEYKPYFNSITIYGGTINAKGGNDCAGIGGSQVSPLGDGDVYIYGGNVTAQGGEYAAGIGGGDNNHISSINIYGGTVTAYSGVDGAGIGGGEDGDSGDINIYGGVVRAYGDRNASGSHKGYGAGIGSGQDGSVNTIIIKGGDIEAYGGEDAAGIGTGEEFEKDGIISGTIEIHGGKVYAYGKGYGAGIGAGEDATFGVMGISGGYVEAKAGVASEPTTMSMMMAAILAGQAGSASTSVSA